jgi:multiple sugar transport system permease protein
MTEITVSPAARPRPARRGLSPMTRRNLRHGLIFISPWIAGFTIFTAYPILASLFYSFTDHDVLTAAEFVGLANYRDLLVTDHLFLTAVKNTLYFAVVSIPLNIVLGVSIALLLNLQVRGMSIYRTIFFVPSIVPQVASALLWAWILNPQFGLANAILKSLGLPQLGWLSDPAWSKPSIVLMGLWAVGGTMVIYLASLQDVPKDLYEAADIDGAGAWRKTRSITLPLITPTIFFNLVLGTISTFQAFTLVYVLTRGGGGPVDSTLVYGLLLYRNAFTYLKMGYASAMAWFLFAFVIVVTYVIFRSSGHWVFYQGEVRQ